MPKRTVEVNLLVGTLALLGPLFSPLLHDAPGPHLAIEHWTSADGLPQNSILGIEELPDGTLGMATMGGFVRFDGQTFEIEDLSTAPQLRSSRFNRLALSPDGRLFASTGDGRVLVREEGVWGYVELENGDPEFVHELRADAKGGLWIATATGLEHTPPGSRQAQRIADLTADALAFTSDGSVLAAGPSGLWSYTGGALELLAEGSFSDVLVQADDDIWGLRDGVLVEVQASGGVTAHPTPFEARGIEPSSGEGIYVFGAAELGYHNESLVWTQDRTALGLPEADQLMSLIVLPGERIWLGSAISGLYYLSPSPLGQIEPEGEPSVFIRAVLTTTDGEVIALGDRLFRLEGAELRAMDTPTVHLIARAEEGGFWLSNDHHLMRWTRSADGTPLIRKVLAFGPELPRPQQMTELADGTLLWASPDALVLFDGSDVRMVPLPSTVGIHSTSALFEDSSGRLWISRDERVHVWDGTEFETYTAGVELPFGAVRSFVETPTGFWLGTYGGGIVHLGPNGTTQITTAQGLHENVASVLVPLGEDLLIVHNTAVAVYDFERLEALAKGQPGEVHGRVFDTGPGVELFESNAHLSPRWAFDATGDLVFPTLGGLAWFDLHMPRTLTTGPNTNIALEITGEASQAADALGIRELERGDHSVRIAFRAPTYIYPPQTHYRYRLAGLHEEWSTTHEPPVLSYNDLGPGSYTFEVQARVGNGPFGPISRSAELHVPWLWWERPFARGLFLVAAVAVVFGLVRLRTRRVWGLNQKMQTVVRDRTKLLQEEVTERMRVEQELRKASEHLEDLVRERTRELAKALSDLEYDIQQREHLERRLLEAEKLETVGRLAGGLAHDFNNILTAILGEADLTDLDLDGERHGSSEDALKRQVRTHVANIRHASERAAGLTRQLLAYSRQQVMQPRTVRPLDTLDSLQPMLLRLLPESCEMSIAPDSSTACVQIDPSQLEQVVVNLFVNAVEAMPDGGRVTARVDREGPADEMGWVVLTVHDEGPGLAADERDRIFEPFFSSKGSTRGLGLASVQGIVYQSQGSIEVDSSPGKGTTFRVLLPETAQQLEPEPSPPPALPSGGRSVLLIDDEDPVREVARQMLVHAGFKVQDFGDPEEALRHLRQRGTDYDILVTDVVMPRLNGKQLAEEARTLAPNLRVLFISGYSAEVLSERELLVEDGQFLSKPFDGATLCSQINALLTEDVVH